jgi:hypothetical protein
MRRGAIEGGIDKSVEASSIPVIFADVVGIYHIYATLVKNVITICTSTWICFSWYWFSPEAFE